MAENITSLLEKEALAAANALGTDVIYIVHGTGTPRDKKMTVAELRKLIGGAAGDITVNSITFTDGTSTYTVELGADGNIFFYTGIATEGDISAKNVETDSIKINTAIDVNSAEFALTSRVASVGDIVILHNVYSSDVTVEVHVVRNSTSGWATAKWNATLKQRSSMMLRCVAIHTINDVKSYEWSPLCNSEVTVNVLA